MLRWSTLSIVLAMVGAVLAALALGQHYNTQPAPCDINSVWDCGIVNHSHYAVLFGVPVALIGVAGYTLLAGLAVAWPRGAVWVALAAFLFSLRMTFLEWRVLQVWCLYCVGSQITITALVATTALGERRRLRSG